MRVSMSYVCVCHGKGGPKFNVPCRQSHQLDLVVVNLKIALRTLEMTHSGDEVFLAQTNMHALCTYMDAKKGTGNSTAKGEKQRQPTKKHTRHTTKRTMAEENLESMELSIGK